MINKLFSLLLLIILTGCSASAILPANLIPASVKLSETASQWELTPATPATQGLIFYPGGFVSPDAYLPLLTPLAEKGFRVVITKPFLNLAVFNPEAALAIAQAEPKLRWYLGGHSLGGAMAAKAAKKQPGLFAGLILLAAYADKGDDLSQSSLPVISITASQDGLSTPAKIAAARPYLPASTRYLVIEGGNHGQFGNYGPQKDDGKATIDAQSQQQQARDAMLSFIGQTSQSAVKAEVSAR